MPRRAYHLSEPATRTTSVVFASPHSGRDYPRWFLAQSRLDEVAIRSSEDAFVDQLLEAAPAMGAPVLCAHAPRAFIDLNRGADELDPALITNVRPGGHNPRVASGLGVIPRVVANGQPIYSGKIPREEAERRIERYWRPYHRVLQSQLDKAVAELGEAILLDVHSMPHEAMDAVVQRGQTRPEVVLGDRFGASAASGIVDRVEAAFRRAGLVVARNSPFAGAYVTQTYGRPARGRHAIQIEIDRALYMDETRIRPNADFDAFKALLRSVLAELVEIGQRREERPLAAE
ncbi:N-formylglutamate amidohydrolase [Roseovarius sp. SCSIO 43702]|uniref:N-formylglutamate amidohydrolase n=1 Tax=Roseovarius sp. SCSIO 43702 TaxID=2823043 RepID=UPI001C737BD4|nr:N-formylglutamate amidohydrolase [Roseovarius sp. SCSIO 43702]QYX56920.1 N-formylglutamate amidohydrolase [Roseovarius sp. SCSIO 43702]